MCITLNLQIVQVPITYIINVRFNPFLELWNIIIKLIITEFTIDKFDSLDNQKQSPYVNNVPLSLEFEVFVVVIIFPIIVPIFL